VNNNKLILVVEDDRGNQILAVERLKRLGLKSEVVSNGQAAVDAVMQRGGEFALILMDLSMPIMDGMTATRVIRTSEASLSHIPIIAVTANGERDICLKAGMDDFVCKPYSNFDLQRVLGKWISIPSPDASGGISFIR
jgi:CheY-like chemotaxis protein